MYQPLSKASYRHGCVSCSLPANLGQSTVVLSASFLAWEILGTLRVVLMGSWIAVIEG